MNSICLTLFYLGGGRFRPPPKETFKFNLTLMGAMLHIIAIPINLRCCHGNIFVMYVSRNRKVKKQDIGLGFWPLRRLFA